MSWFRIHTSLRDNAKIQLLAPKDFKNLINLWCLAKDGDGVIPAVPDIAFKLRMTDEQVRKAITALPQLIEQQADGTFRAHDWNEHQYQSDVSTNRVKQFRERQRNVSGNQIETPPEYRVQTTDTEETPIPLSAPKAGAVDIWFETDFWPKWLRRPDDDLPGPALKAARSVAKTVAIRKQIMAAVEACRADREEKEPGYRVSARRWLREGMWEVSAVESAKPQELWPGQLGGRPHPDAIMRNFKKGDFIR
jgi:hypothetical protein